LSVHPLARRAYDARSPEIPVGRGPDVVGSLVLAGHRIEPRFLVPDSEDHDREASDVALAGEPAKVHVVARGDVLAGLLTVAKLACSQSAEADLLKNNRLEGLAAAAAYAGT
jgi:hypothetical protein